ncbi:MAG: Poly polymerase [Benniella sp.]|nr:MAG: Poly polymerase [Benniella sp.]
MPRPSKVAATAPIAPVVHDSDSDGQPDPSNVEKHSGEVEHKIEILHRKKRVVPPSGYDGHIDKRIGSLKAMKILKATGEDTSLGPARRSVANNDEDVDLQPLSRVHKLLEAIFDASRMVAELKKLDYDADRLPLGKLIGSTILVGYDVLKRIGDELNKHTPRLGILMELSIELYKAIPHNFGYRIPAIINDRPTLGKKLEILETLEGVEMAQKLIKRTTKYSRTANLLDQLFDSLNLSRLEPMSKRSDRYRLIEQYARNTHDSARTGYDLVLEEVFDLEREGESERFISSGSSKLHRRLLWHGSR